MFVSEPGLINQIRESYGHNEASEERIISRCRHAGLLILDDVGVAHVKPEAKGWYEDIMWRLLDSSPKPPPPLLLTTNLKRPEFFARLGARASDRLIQMLGSKANYVEMFGVPSYRLRDW